MSRVDAVVSAITGRSRAAIAAMLVLTLVLGAGAGMVEQSSSLDQFQSDTPESKKLEYIQQNFSVGQRNTTSVQLIARDENVLDKESLVGLLELERKLRSNGTIEGTLAENNSVVGIPNVVATTAIRQEQGAELQRTAAEFERLNATVSRERAAIENRSRTLNATAADLRSSLTTLRRNPDASVEAQWQRVKANTTVELNRTDYRRFQRAARGVRNAQNRSQVEQAYRLGTRGVLADDYAALRERSEALQRKAERLRELGQELQAQNEAFENASNPTLDQQLEQLRSMNESEIDGVLTLLLSENASGNGGSSSAVFAFMPTSYDPGSTEANATMLVVTQRTSGGGAAMGGAGERITESQLAMQTIAAGDAANVDEVLVFGSGVIGEEITQSMTDSLLIVGPLALVFVVVALVVAYRDLIDILLGVAGIFVVLIWTFGFMGWAGIAFNQMFVAVPVLLIGLSIDYAIHVFMRHREERAGPGPADRASGDDRERTQHGGEGVRDSMRVALAGVGVALVWVTATTVIGFLSNLTSPVPPIRDFGVVSAFGITAALLVFGVLTPALKVEIDSFLEGRGWNREKRAFGTGGGRFSSALAAGATAAKKAPFVVILLALVLSAGGAYGASQVDTSFNQEDFLADDPPAWTYDLPEPFEPGRYTAKDNLDYVNEHFLRQDSQAQILVEGEVTGGGTLEEIAQAQRAAAQKEDVVSVLSNGEARIRSPLTVMRSVAARNESFRRTFVAADTDGNGVPDRNLKRVYDELFAVAPDRAAGVIHRTDGGDYEAVRLVVFTQGTASGEEVTEAMRDVAAGIEGENLEATATGQEILFKIVQDQLLETVVQSLVITLVATFAFLMVTYRITEGSASLGAVTLLPVALSVTWILGTMYLVGIPFNILTGMITSLTVGLGVAYSIHLSERFNQELERTGDLWESMDRAVTGTGGALLGSAATTVGGFGVLAFAILPPLQQFGIITGLTIVYAFLASVLVLPSLLVVWYRYLGPDGSPTERPGRPTSAHGED